MSNEIESKLRHIKTPSDEALQQSLLKAKVAFERLKTRAIKEYIDNPKPKTISNFDIKRDKT